MDDLISREATVAAIRRQDKGSVMVLGGQNYKVVQLAEVLSAVAMEPAAESDVPGPFPAFRLVEGAGQDSPALIAVRQIYRDREAKLKAALDNRDWEIKQLKLKIEGNK